MSPTPVFSVDNSVIQDLALSGKSDKVLQSFTRISDAQAVDLLTTWRELQANYPGFYEHVEDVVLDVDGYFHLVHTPGTASFNIVDFINERLDSGKTITEFFAIDALGGSGAVGTAKVGLAERVAELHRLEALEKREEREVHQASVGVSSIHELVIGDGDFDDEEATMIYEDEEETTTPTETIYYSVKLLSTGDVFKVVPHKTITMGRGSSCEVRITNHKNLSRNHAKLSINARGELYLEDLKSANGTYFKGQPIHKPVKLDAGDSFELFKEKLTVISKGVL